MTASAAVRLLPVGDTAWLVEAEELTEVRAWDTAVRDAGIPGVIDVVPAARTLLVRFDPHRGDRDAVREGLAALRPEPASPDGAPAGELVEVPVTYDGPDLPEVARRTGLTVAEVVEAHAGTAWEAAFSGFLPGFAYLAGGDRRLRVPRRAEPRTRVPAGAIALAGEWSAVYPRESPGGWQLLGRTDLTLWDPRRDPPATLRPGVRVRFVAAGP
jgi:KipI family sensor histidine kinase inhibitor